MTRFPVDDLGVIYRQAAQARDISDAEIARAKRNGDITVVGPGCYLPRHDHRTREELHRLSTLAMAHQPARGDGFVVVSHTSAAVLHDVAMLAPKFDRVHFTLDGPGGNVRRWRHTHPGPVPPEEITIVDGVAVTTIERSAVDVACAGNFASALAVFDSALRRGADQDEIARILNRGRRRGGPAAKRALAQANPLSANPGESWSRAQIITAGLPVPQLQCEHRINGKTFFTDLEWEDTVVGEFDGMVKYTKLLVDGETAADVVIAEKLREDLLRREGRAVLRWVWADLRAQTVVPDIRRALIAAGIIRG